MAASKDAVEAERGRVSTKLSICRPLLNQITNAETQSFSLGWPRRVRGRRPHTGTGKSQYSLVCFGLDAPSPPSLARYVQ